jgi:hypothetical protein
MPAGILSFRENQSAKGELEMFCEVRLDCRATDTDDPKSFHRNFRCHIDGTVIRHPRFDSARTINNIETRPVPN